MAIHTLTLRVALCISFLLSVLPLSANAAVLSRPANNLGLVGYWSFNEGTSTIAGDFSGNGLTGTLSGTVKPNWVSGRHAGALNFDGDTSYVSLGTPTSLKFSAQPFTVSAWVKMDASTQYGRIVGLDNGGSFPHGFTLRIYNNSGWEFYFLGGGSATNSVSTAFTTAGFETGVWHLLTGVYDGNNVSIYVDGVYKHSASTPVGSISPVWSGVTDFEIGSRPGGAASNHFDGAIDDVRIYNRELSASEIRGLYRAGSVTIRAGSIAGNSGLSGSLTASWSFDSSTVSGTSVADQSGNGHTLTLVNGASITAGRTNEALTLDGSNQYAYGLIGALPTSVALSMWVKPNDVSTTQSILTEQGDGAPSSGYHFTLVGIRSGAFYAGFWDIGDIASTPITAGNWYHVILTYDGVAHTQSLYVDGVLQGTQSGTWSPPSNIYFLPGLQQQSCSFTNASGHCGDLAQYFNGQIDDLQGYDQAFTQSDVDSLSESITTFNANTANGSLTNGLIGYWSFNGADVTSVINDRSGQGNNGGFFGGATSSAKVIGKIGQALHFNGNSQYVSATGSYPTGTNPRSLCAWVQSDDTSFQGNADHVVNYGTASTNEAFGFMIHTGDQWRFYGHGGAVDFDTGISVDTNWHHHCLTYDGTTVIYYYDGVNVAQQARTLATTGGAMTFGIRPDLATTNEFNGSIDEVRVYNRALSSVEVKRLYNAGK